MNEEEYTQKLRGFENEILNLLEKHDKLMRRHNRIIKYLRLSVFVWGYLSGIFLVKILTGGI